MTQTERYNSKEVEPRWRKEWEARELFRTQNDDPRPKYYVLEMFPYPSGRIHMGHVRNYAMGDVVARYMRAKGFNVLHPMGWDAFGLPAENAARDNKVNPRDWTYSNIATMKAQLQTMGLSLDWSRELATCDPSYYKHQQKMFLDFWKAGLVERKSAKVNWDPVDMTVLANEQVIDGRGWRSDALVEQRDLTQWFFKITTMSEELLTALDGLDRWPDKVKLMQRNWIGRSDGLLVRWALKSDERRPPFASSKSLRRARTRSSAHRSWRYRRTILWPRRRRPPILTSPLSVRRAAAWGRPSLRLRLPRKSGSIPAFALSSRSIRRGKFRIRRELHPDGVRHGRDFRLPLR